jgi:hypothetical protein
MRPEGEIIDVASLDKLVPKTLDDVIREHRDYAALRFANEAELTSLLADMPHESSAQDIRNWSLITLDWQTLQQDLANVEGWKGQQTNEGGDQS